MIRVGLDLSVAAVLLLAIGCSSGSGRPPQSSANKGAPGAAATQSDDDRRVVATVNERPITAADVRLEMVRRGADMSDQFKNVAVKRSLLDDMVQKELLAEAALKAGYADDPEIKAATRRLMAEKFWRQRMTQVGPEIQVSENDLETYFEKHKQEYAEPERARGAAMLLRFPPNASNADKAQVRARAKEIADQVRSGADPKAAFAASARANSDDLGTRERGGDIGWIVKGATTYRWAPKIIDALFALPKPGDVAEPVDTDEGTVLVSLLERAGGQVPEFSAVEAKVRVAVANEKRQAVEAREFAQLKQEFRTTVDDALLAEIGPRANLAATGSQPPGFPITSATN